MQKISLQKRSFFNSIGLDINNLPAELQIKANSIQKKLPLEDLKFLSQKSLTIPKVKHFRLKNLFGTDNIKLDNMTWIDIFSNSEKTDEIIKLYFKNPNYYYKELRKLDQSELNHNNPIELYESNGKFFIKEGAARLSLMMIKYLLEMSRAQSKEEKIIINKQYIFAGSIRSVPKDRDIMYLINMLLEIYGPKLKLQKIDNDNECSYIMKYDERKFEINSKSDLENFIKNSYLPREYKSTEKFKMKLQNISKIGIEYKENEEIVDQFLVMGKIFPNYEIFVKYYRKMIKYNLEDKLIEKLDLKNITYDDILKKLIKIVKQEEIGMGKLELKDKIDNNEELKKTKSKKAVSKKETVKKDEVKKVSKKSEKVEKKATKKTTKKEDEKAKENEEKLMFEEKLKVAKDSANAQTKDILEDIEMIYYKLKTEESKFFDLANSTNIELNIDRINDDSLNSSINSIKENIFILKKRIDEMDKIEDVNYINEFFKDIVKISSDKNILTEFSDEMKSIYTICFNKNIQKMITDSKLKKIDKQRKEIESEKCSFFSKLIGKAKLKQAKLDNINLKEQLILTESQFSSSSYYSLEDGLAELYAYDRTEEDFSCLSEIKIYIKNLETNNQIKSMTDQEKLTRRIKERIEQQRNLPQLVLSKEKRRFFSKAQINLVQEKNNELKRVIQINRANSLKLQNTGMIPIIGNIKTTKAVRKFINNLNQIEKSIESQNS